MHKNRLCLVAKENQDRAGLELGQKWTKKKLKALQSRKTRISIRLWKMFTFLLHYLNFHPQLLCHAGKPLESAVYCLY